MNILTFDIEPWYLSYSSSQIPISEWDSLPFRAEQVTLELLDFLDNHNQKATFFIMGWLAEKNPNLIKEITLRGHEIGYHSYFHILPENQTKKEFENDLAQGLNLLTKITSRSINLYRAPQFSINEASGWVYPILAKNGITTSSSIRSDIQINKMITPNSHILVHTPNGNIMEFPLGRYSFLGRNWVYSGGGYIRFFFYYWIHKQFSLRHYNMAYFHPRDFDNHIPSTELLPNYRNWMNRHRNHTTFPKLAQLLQDFKFISLGQAIHEIDRQVGIMTIEVNDNE